MAHTIVKQFNNVKVAEKFINVQENNGYELVDMTDGKKHYSITKGIGVGLLLGPIGLLFGRGKTRLTITMHKD